MSDRLLTPDDLAAHFGTERRTILEWAKKYAWPRTQVGRSSYWTAEQLAQIERQHSVTPAGVAPKSGQTMRSAARNGRGIASGFPST